MGRDASKPDKFESYQPFVGPFARDTGGFALY